MLRRLLTILKRALIEICQIPENIKEFDLKTSMWLWYVGTFPSKRQSKGYIKAITEYTDKYFKDVTESFKNGTYDKNTYIPENAEIPKKIPVWVCWLQGEESMPELVKTCYKQLKKNIPDYAELILLSFDNIGKYIELPDYIKEKNINGKIANFEFADILRVSLLYAYGGMWIDSTVFTARTLPKDFFENEFYGQKMKDENEYWYEPSKAKWSGFLMSGKKENTLFAYVRNTMYHYWKKHNKLVEYIMLDYCILSAYNNFDKFKKQIDNIKCNNEELWELNNHINDKFDIGMYNDMIKKTTFFKLSYKGVLKDCTDSGDMTFYKYIKEIN